VTRVSLVFPRSKGFVWDAGHARKAVIYFKEKKWKNSVGGGRVTRVSLVFPRSKGFVWDAGHARKAVIYFKEKKWKMKT
tara:strand:- start:328 stop:564 length:237 start_codon:yes stop_codon:yes gene_type:complete